MHASLIFGTININNKAEINFLHFSIVTHFSRRVRRKNNVQVVGALKPRGRQKVN